MHALSIADWKSWRSDFNRLPFVRAVAEAPFPKSWLPWWRHSRVSALLETGKAGRYTIFAPQFELLIACNAASSLLLHLRKGVPTTAENVEGSPFETLRNLTSSYRAPKLDRFPPFLGGWIGFLSYDLVRLLEQIPETAARDLDVPFAGFGLAEEAFVYDHKQSILFCCTHFKVSKKTTDSDLEAGFSAAQIRTEEMRRLWEKRVHESHAIPTPTPARAAPPSPGRLSFSREEFVKAVQHVQDRIRAGETYQTNLSIRETRPLRATPEAVYEKLRQINPSPYMGLLRLPDFSLVSGSPELLIRLHNGKLEARPIAGTRPRGSDAETDRALSDELIGNSKERAEHLMLVDLIRNDIGRVAEYGSVAVTEFMTVEQYSHVMHIVSHIEGRLRDGLDGLDAIAAVFPGGTITGAPKIRTMQIIEELEPVRRGPYTGSIGWISFSGNLELNITIRTLLALNGEAHVQAGAGIVIDSDPDREYEEAINKARALWAAVEAAEAESSDQQEPNSGYTRAPR